jgi:regulator of protease activity HflC (stomatin/prohibitin superfamily)
MNRTWLAVLAVSLTACTGVDETEHCVETRYGKVVTQRMTPGLSNTFMTDVTCFNLTQQQFPGGTDDAGKAIAEKVPMFLKDSVTVDAELSFLWRYNNAGAAFTEKRAHDGVVAELSNAVRSAARDAGSTIALADLFTQRAALDDRFKQAIQAKSPAYVTIERVFLREVIIPENIRKAWSQAMEQRAQREQITSQYVSDSLRNRSAIQKAESESRVVMVKAEADAKAKELEARAMATSPEVLRLKQAEALATGLGKICSGPQVTNCSIGQQTLADIMGRFSGAPK